MKKLYISILSVFMITSCTDFDLEDQGFVLEELPSYVAFNQAGTSAADLVEDVVEGASVTWELEAPTGTLSDITVNYSWGGDAIFGVDFDLAGSSASGGSLVIDHDPGDVNNFDNVEFTIDLLLDGTQDGNKVLTMVLESATNADGETFAVGRGGTDFLKTGTINIAEADCGNFAGTYVVLGTILVDDFGSGPYNSTEVIGLVDCTVEGDYGVADISGGLYTNSYATNYTTSARATIITIDGSNNVTWASTSDQFGGFFIEDTAAATPSNYNPTTDVITINWTATAFGERGITTYTLQ